MKHLFCLSLYERFYLRVTKLVRGKFLFMEALQLKGTKGIQDIAILQPQMKK